ncbi:MAG TPA: transferrin receptor-like dimerization domain-containing protein [Candidatus Eisenbacteria bacterium]|nr:transferrin receptor-like dimerization domain-containing protein [Candidatus Eisenbacteria bacterium]
MLRAKYLFVQGDTVPRTMRRILIPAFVSVAVLFPANRFTIADEPILAGFTAESSRAERQWEEKFKAIPSPQLMRDYMQRLSARPHNVGAPYDKDNAEWLLAKFKEFGLDAHIETFDILFPTPEERAVELVEGGPKFTAKLQEPAVVQDPTSSQQSEQLPTYNAYSIDGDITAPLVFVNYGIPEDYEQLARLGVSVQGAIVIAKYGHSWRGIKPKVAAEHGAVGCLIYSDPNEDGFKAGETFPAGAYRPRDGVQRGSVADDPIYPGDPLTPGVGATKDAKRLDLKDVAVLTKIPVLPISYGDAEPLLAAISGQIAPHAWRGGLSLTYHVGPGPAKVHLKVKSDWNLKTIYDVIGKIPGSTDSGQWIIRGNHHDAWVNGAEDPISGLIAVMEEARALGELVKQGWKPKRTILFCAWDAEEPGLIGSTEWAEQHAAELQQHAVVYINSDVSTRGYFGAEGSHTLEKFINEVARDIQDPETRLSIWKRAQLRQIGRPDDLSERQEARSRTDLRIGALGSGSDYGAFLQHDGVAALNLGFGGEDGGGIYHSIYDDFYWYTHFADTDFIYGRALAQTAGTAVMRLAGADLLPFEYTNFADTIETYVKELKTLAQKSRDEIIERNRELDEGVFAAMTDPRVKSVPPPREAVPPFLNFAPLDNATDLLNRAAGEYRKALEKAATNGGSALAKASLAEVNLALAESEQKLTLDKGLPGRPWFKHFVDAPGQYTGYEAKTLPAVREPIEQKQWKDVDAQIVVTAHVLEAEAAHILSVAQKLDAAVGK